MNAPSPKTPITGNDAATRSARAGLLFGLVAYGLWGILPIYFKLLQSVPPVDIVAHRIVWSLLALGLLVTLMRAWDQVRVALRHRRTLVMLTISALLIGANWLLYIYAINSGHILAGSLGYYLNPLANILLGRFILKEQLSRLQWAAVAIAAAGISVLLAGALGTLWISLTLCFSFATYGLIRKVFSVDSLAGLTIETMLLAPIAIGWLLLGGVSAATAFGSDATQTALLIATGVISTIPLLCFTAAARRLPYATVGMLQFVAPTLQFVLAVALYGEPFTRAHAIAFGAIWTALALYVVALVGQRRRAALAS